MSKYFQAAPEPHGQLAGEALRQHELAVPVRVGGELGLAEQAGLAGRAGGGAGGGAAAVRQHLRHQTRGAHSRPALTLIAAHLNFNGFYLLSVQLC